MPNSKNIAIFTFILIAFALIIVFKPVLGRGVLVDPTNMPSVTAAPSNDPVKDAAQDLMNKAQNQIEQGADKVSEAATKAVQDQIDQQIQNTKKNFWESIKGGMKWIEDKVKLIVVRIKNFIIESIRA